MKEYDVLIIGAGPAGLTAGIYAARAGAKVGIVEKSAPGGKANLANDLENYMGTDGISGSDLMIKSFSQAEKYGAENIILMGDGAGGSIALSLCSFLKEAGLPKPGGVAAVSPVCDLSLSNPALEEKAASDPILGIEGLRLAAKKWCGARTPLDKLLNPMDMDASALPELLLICGAEELLAPDVRLFAKHVNLCGGKAELLIHKEMYHAFPLYPLKSGACAAEHIAAWLNR